MSSHDKQVGRDPSSDMLDTTYVDYHKLFEMMDDGVAVCELVRDELGRPTDYLVLEVNRAFENHTGLSPSKAAGRKRSEFISIPNEHFLGVAAQIIASDRPDRLDHYNEGLDRWFSIGVFPLGGDRFVQLFHDITERKRAEVALRESEKLSTALNQINSYINSTLDPDEIMQWVLEAGTMALGAESSLINGREGDHWVAQFVHNFPPSILGHPKTDEESPVSMLVLKERNAVAIDDAYNDPRVDRQNMKAYGARSVLVAPIIVRNEVIGIIAFYHHSKQVRFSQAQNDFAYKLSASLSLAMENARLYGTLSESMAKYRGLFENIQELAAIYEYVEDSSGKLIDAKLLEANPLWLKANGADPRNVQGKNLSELFSDEFFGNVLLTIRQLKETGEPIVLERPFPPEGPESRSSFFPLDEDHFVVTALDISIIKKAQREAEEYARKLERSNIELQSFAYLASHDLQEPLRMVISYLSLLDRRYKEELDPQAKEYINHAVEGGTRMRQLIDDLLEYSRIESKAKAFAPANMGEIVDSTIKLLQVPIDDSKADICIEPMPMVMADESQMQQVMQNLLSNALKFKGPERPIIHISAREGRREWTFSVKDNGIGLDGEYADRIFQMFQRLHNQDQYPGTGVGLAIVKKIVERHGGRIWVESEEGKGAAFFFTIPNARK